MLWSNSLRYSGQFGGKEERPKKINISNSRREGDRLQPSLSFLVFLFKKKREKRQRSKKKKRPTNKLLAVTGELARTRDQSGSTQTLVRIHSIADAVLLHPAMSPSSIVRVHAKHVMKNDLPVHT